MSEEQTPLEYTSSGKLKAAQYNRELARLQQELVMLHHWIKETGLKVVIIFEGRDAAGKGGVIKRITQRLNPRIARVVALGTPSNREKEQWYFQRYVPHLPSAGEIVLFDRSWYNRAGVERVMGFCSDHEYQDFLRTCPEFERMLVRSEIKLIKYWFSVSDEEQERRFRIRNTDPARRWKLSPMDLESRTRWVEYEMNKRQKLWCIAILRQAYKSKILTGVPATPTAAQAILESGYGKNEPYDSETGKRSYNLFGVKAYPDRGLVGNNGFVECWTHEQVGDKLEPKYRCFKAYLSHKDSFSDHAEVLKLDRYKKAFDYPHDPEFFIAEVWKGGYATDKKYLIKIIPIIRALNKIPVWMLKLL